MDEYKFTTKQRLFIEAYDGNATQAAIKAGYSKKTAHAIGKENLHKPPIALAIRERQNKIIQPLIATREDRQKFWTSVQNDPKASMSDRLRASELLGKSVADFSEKHIHEGNLTVVRLPAIKVKGQEINV